jgi:hypothetical protein
MQSLTNNYYILLQFYMVCLVPYAICCLLIIFNAFLEHWKNSLGNLIILKYIILLVAYFKFF